MGLLYVDVSCVGALRAALDGGDAEAGRVATARGFHVEGMRDTLPPLCCSCCWDSCCWQQVVAVCDRCGVTAARPGLCVFNAP